MKPQIFIGSSREGLSTAQQIKKELEDIADCHLWNEGFFELNRSSFESLAIGAVLFDFAILVASADDVQLKREKLESVARDNVIFEFGLYIGRLNRNKALFVKANNLDIPSDLHGITFLQYKTAEQDHGSTLSEVCKDLRTHIEKVWKTFELSFVPSTVLAFGYFENFLSHVCRELKQSAKRVVNEKSYSNFKLHVIIPDELPDNFNDQVIEYLSNKDLKEMKVETDTRKYNFYLEYADDNDSMLELYDLPTTLSALKKAIEMAIPSGAIGETEKERLLKKKEMFNFCRTLEYLIKSSPITKKNVVIEFIDVN